MRILLGYAYYTFAMVSFISSCLFVLLVASESTKIQQNLNNNKKDEIKDNYEINNKYINDKELNIKKIKHENDINLNVNKKQKNENNQIDTNDLIFLENLSKNSGITENEVPDLPSTVPVTLVEKPKELIENVIKGNVIKKQNVSKSLSFKTINISSAYDVPEQQDKNGIDGNIQEENVIAEPKTDTKDNLEIVIKNEEKLDETENVLNVAGDDGILKIMNENNIVKDDSGFVNILNNNNTNLTEENQIPLYSEWAQKHLEESEKLEQESVSNLSTTKKNETIKKLNVKLRAKNYASPDCGAKIIASNSDAQSTSSVLTNSKDEYMLNPCQSRIWFVVELCEPIRAEKIELANFELFSSSPKQFSVGVSNRYPTREWSIVGQFTAKDERDIQKFKLHPHLFGKFIKVDVHSHYSSEHFCPISLFSVYGTSEFEAFATENEVINTSDEYNEDEDDDEDILSSLLGDNENHKSNTKKGNQNYLKSASDAVISMVKKVGEVLTKTGSDKTTNNNHISNTNFIGYTPNYSIICKNCKEELIKMIEYNIEFKYYEMNKNNRIYEILLKTQFCVNLVNDLNSNNHILVNLLPIHYAYALCNIVINEQKVKNIFKSESQNDKNSFDSNSKILNIEKKFTENDNGDDNEVNKLDYNTLIVDETIKNNSDVPCETTIESTDNIETTTNSDELFINNVIEPTPTIHNEFLPETSIEKPPALKDIYYEQVIEMSPSPPTANLDSNEYIENTDEIHQYNLNVPITTTPDTIVVSTPDVEKLEENAEDVGDADGDKLNQNENQAVPILKGHTDSVFLRLSSRIKSLERNLSLTEQYLEELSRRYKKQVEELQLSFAKLLTTVDDQNRRSTDREQLLIERNDKLREDVDYLTDKMNSWFNIYLIGFILFEIILVTTLAKICRRRNDFQLDNCNYNRTRSKNENGKSKNNKLLKFLRRRNSLEELNSPNSTFKNKRRLSEEALQTYGTYDNLLIVNGDDNSDDIQTIYSIDELAINEKYDKKKSKNRQRKISNPNQKRALSVEPVSKSQNKSKIQLFRNESAPGTTGVPSNNLNQTKNYPIKEVTLLDENDEIYMPNMDLALNEFMPDGPSYHKNSSTPISINDKSSNSSSSSTKSNKKRRLSSPAFFKSALSRNSLGLRKSPSPIQENRTTIATGWEWLNKKNSSQELKNNNSNKKLNNLINISSSSSVTSSSGKQKNLTSDSFIPLNKLKTENLNLIEKKDNGALPSASSSTTGGSFKKLFKKVF